MQFVLDSRKQFIVVFLVSVVGERSTRPFLICLGMPEIRRSGQALTGQVGKIGQKFLGNSKNINDFRQEHE